MTTTTTTTPATPTTRTAVVVVLPARKMWPERAACRDTDPDIFFGRPDKYGVDRHDPDELVRATRLCAGCPVREECLADALDRGADVEGIWGGCTKKDRERLVRRIARVKCPICSCTMLLAHDGWQACGGCGHSWPTARPVQRTTTGRAA
jgi:WhiB family redox-sensing transcriptional regulator